jgi:hypothetical protein
MVGSRASEVIYHKLTAFRHEDILIPFIDNYEKDGTYDKEFAEKARQQSKEPHDGDRVGKVLLRVLGIA